MFAGREDRRNQDFIRRGKTRGEIRHQGFGAGDLVRLEGAPDPAGTEHVPSRLQRRLNRRRMMGVIVDNRHAPPLADVFKPPANTAEYACDQ